MTYVLHYAPDNASLIIRLALEHLGLPYRVQLVDRARGGQSDPGYLALNPNGLIPVLETPQGPLFETGAILLYLGDTQGGLGPQPQDGDRGDYLKWLFFTSNTLHPALRMLFYPAKYIGADADDQNALRRGLRGHLHRTLLRLDAVAGTGHAWLGAPQTPGALDFYLAVCLRWCALYPADMDRGWFGSTHYPHLATLCRNVEAQPCSICAQHAEGLGPTPFSAPAYADPPEGSAT